MMCKHKRCSTHHRVVNIDCLERIHKRLAAHHIELSAYSQPQHINAELS